MNNYFYYWGFLYAIYLLNKLYNTFRIKQQDVTVITDKMDVVQLMELKLKIPKQTINTILPRIISAIFFAWMYLGYAYNTQEKYWFMSYLLFDLLYHGFMIYLIISIAMSAVFGSKARIHNEKEKKPLKIPADKIVPIVNLTIVAYILFHHFIISQ